MVHAWSNGEDNMAVIDKRLGRHGKTVYRVRVRLQGKLLRTATLSTQRAARQWARKTEACLHREQYVPPRSIPARNWLSITSNHSCGHSAGKAVTFGHDKPHGGWAWVCCRSVPYHAGLARVPGHTRPAVAWARQTIKKGSQGPMVVECAALRVVAVRGGTPGAVLMSGWCCVGTARQGS